MTTAQLAKRLGVAQPSVIGLEKAEASKVVTIATLERAAHALDCTLVYALVPRKPLETIVRERARDAAQERLRTISHSMALEDQRVGPLVARGAERPRVGEPELVADLEQEPARGVGELAGQCGVGRGHGCQYC